MTNIKKILLISLFDIALPTICMELVDAPKIQVLEDGQEWVVPRRLEHLDPFLGKVIAVIPPGKKIDDCAYAYQINPGLIVYAFVLEKDGIERGEVAILKYVVKRESSECLYDDALTSKRLHDRDFSMRLLTVNEACHLATAAEDGQLVYWAQLGGTKVVPINPNFKLDHLAPKERRRYVRKHCHEHKELKYIQTLCGIRQKRQRQTELGLLPKDVLKIVFQNVIDGEIAQNDDLLLNVRKPKKPRCSECVVQ